MRQDQNSIDIITSHPIIVITLPVFNEEKYIQETLESISNQTWRDFKVLISDNASTDNTALICQEYCRHDSRFMFVQQASNMGACANFEYLLMNTESRYFMWLGGHDVLHPNFLSTHIKFLDSHEDFTLSYSCTQWIDEESVYQNRSRGGRIAEIQGKPWVRYLDSIACLGEYTCINQLIRRNALKNLNIEPVFAMDQIILSRLIYFGLSHREEEALYLARVFNKKRPQTEMERVSGKKNTRINFKTFKQAYLKDLQSIDQNLSRQWTFKILLLCALEKKIFLHRIKYTLIPKLKNIFSYTQHG